MGGVLVSVLLSCHVQNSSNLSHLTFPASRWSLESLTGFSSIKKLLLIFKFHFIFSFTLSLQLSLFGFCFLLFSS